MNNECINSPFGKKKDAVFMQQALAQAQYAFERDEVPVGAVVVTVDGKVVARAYNQVEVKKTQAAHAELLAIIKAGKKMNNWRLIDCWLFVTLEPCSMCMNLIQLSRFAGVVFGAASPLFGYRLDSKSLDQVYKRAAITVVSGVCAEESGQLLKRFFNQKRK